MKRPAGRDLAKRDGIVLSEYTMTPNPFRESGTKATIVSPAFASGTKMMNAFTRTLKVLIALLVLAAVVLWFAAQRSDRGYIEEEITVDRPAAVVFHWLTTDELLRRWISDSTKLQRVDSVGSSAIANSVYEMDGSVGTRRVSVQVRVLRVIPNQELELSVNPASGSEKSFNCTAEFKLLPSGEYTRVLFSSRTAFYELGGQAFEPVLTYAARKKVQESLARLKWMAEAETANHRD
jgi:uncharacterized protein YndB with AHSA1/START domain